MDCSTSSPAADNSALAAQLVAESQARRSEPSAAIGTFDTPAPENNALIQELIAGSEARRSGEPGSAVSDLLSQKDLTDRQIAVQQMIEGLKNVKLMR